MSVAMAGCDDHAASNWEVISQSTEGCELAAQCYQCGARLYKFVPTADLDRVDGGRDA